MIYGKYTAKIRTIYTGVILSPYSRAKRADLGPAGALSRRRRREASAEPGRERERERAGGPGDQSTGQPERPRSGRAGTEEASASGDQNAAKQPAGRSRSEASATRGARRARTPAPIGSETRPLGAGGERESRSQQAAARATGGQHRARRTGPREHGTRERSATRDRSEPANREARPHEHRYGWGARARAPGAAGRDQREAGTRGARRGRGARGAPNYGARARPYTLARWPVNSDAEPINYSLRTYYRAAGLCK